MRSVSLVVVAAALVLAGCEKPKPAEPATPTEAEQAPAQMPAPELTYTDAPDEPEEPQPVRCDPGSQGGVKVTTNGIPGDSFRVTLTCGGQVIASCTATIPPGAVKETCVGPAKQLVAGERKCTLGQGNGNSPGAKPTDWGCG